MLVVWVLLVLVFFVVPVVLVFLLLLSADMTGEDCGEFLLRKNILDFLLGVGGTREGEGDEVCTLRCRWTRYLLVDLG